MKRGDIIKCITPDGRTLYGVFIRVVGEEEAIGLAFVWINKKTELNEVYIGIRNYEVIEEA